MSHGPANGQCSDQSCLTHSSIWPTPENLGGLQVYPGNLAKAVGELPICPTCASTARPNVLMFNDGGFASKREEAQRRRYDEWVGLPRSSRDRKSVVSSAVYFTAD